MKRKCGKLRLRQGLMALLLAVCVQAGNAFAQEASLVEVLHTGGMAAYQDALSDSIQVLNETVTVDGVKLTATGLVYDGERFAIGWTAENLQQDAALVTFEAVRVGGEVLTPSTELPAVSWLPNVFGLDSVSMPVESITGGMQAEVNGKNWQGRVPVEIVVTVKRPEKPVAVVDAELYKTHADERVREQYVNMRFRMEQFWLTVAGEDALDPAAWERDGYMVVDCKGQYYINGMFYNEVELLGIEASGSGLVKAPQMRSERVSISAMLDVDAAMAHVTVLEPDDVIDLQDCTVHIKRVKFSPISTVIEYDLIPAEGYQSFEGAAFLMQRYYHIGVLDGEGNPLKTRNGPQMQAVHRNGTDVQQREGGSWYGHCELYLDGLLEWPYCIRLIPSGSMDDESLARYEAFAEAVLIFLP